MAKIFQILNGFCHWDATLQFPTLESTVGFFAPYIQFAEAPDHVFEHWGYDETKEGEDRFIQPKIPVGWAYDLITGTYYPLIPEPEPEPEQETDYKTLLASADQYILELEYENLILKEGLA